MLKRNTLFLFVLILLGCFTATRAQTVFDQKRQEYLNTNGSNLRGFHERIWAWLENIKTGQINGDTYIVTDVDGNPKPVNQIIHNIIRSWGTPWNDYPQSYPPYNNAWCFGPWQEHVMLIWIYLGYGDIISSSDRVFLRDLYGGTIQSKDFSPGSENTRLADHVSRYLYSQDHQDINVIFSYNPPPNDNIFEFTWEERTYTPGLRYNALALSRDWLNWSIDQWLRRGNPELDSPIYTWTFVHCFSALFEFAHDPLMKRKAKMMVDFLLLESILDFSANQWGGAIGRSYKDVFLNGRGRFYWDVFWNMRASSEEPSRSILVSSYRIPDVIFDIGDLSDESDNYYHINMENNKSLSYAPNSGQWNWVTKYYNLGGGQANYWQLAIYSEDTPGSSYPGIPFFLWINNLEPGEGELTGDFGSYLERGKLGYQYKNAMFVRGSTLNIARGPNQWDDQLDYNGWRFFKEGKTMIAVRLRPDLGTGGLEVAIEGVDYGSFGSFQNAILANASLDSYKFVTSRGDWVSYAMSPVCNDYAATVKRQGASDYEFVWDYPLRRVQTVDYQNHQMVQWLNDSMIVTKHGKRLTYDFDNWTVTESLAPSDTTAPAPPGGLSVQQRR